MPDRGKRDQKVYLEARALFSHKIAKVLKAQCPDIGIHELVNQSYFSWTKLGYEDKQKLLSLAENLLEETRIIKGYPRVHDPEKMRGQNNSYGN